MTFIMVWHLYLAPISKSIISVNELTSRFTSQQPPSIAKSELYSSSAITKAGIPSKNAANAIFVNIFLFIIPSYLCSLP